LSYPVLKGYEFGMKGNKYFENCQNQPDGKWNLENYSMDLSFLADILGVICLMGRWEQQQTLRFSVRVHLLCSAFVFCSFVWFELYSHIQYCQSPTQQDGSFHICILTQSPNPQPA
jgi:hypothetical protein